MNHENSSYLLKGKWGSWTKWSVCSARSCDYEGLQWRQRLCTNPMLPQGGASCKGTGTETVECVKIGCCDSCGKK